MVLINAYVKILFDQIPNLDLKEDKKIRYIGECLMTQFFVV